MIYTGYDIVWLFFVYSFLGWAFETVVAAFKQRHFVNRGLVTGPLCVIYGIGAVTITLFCWELHGLWLFVGSFILAALIEWIAGHLVEKFYHEKWWDYSQIRWNLDGYICFPVSLLWAVFSVIMMEWGNPLLKTLFALLPDLLEKISIWVLVILLVLDVTATMVLLSGRTKRKQQWHEVESWLNGINSKLGRWIYKKVDGRINKAYPKAAEKLEESTGEKENTETVFAYGCGFYKVFWLLLIGAFMGDVVETIFCRLTTGIWMSRSSLVWGDFSLVWGFAIAGITVLLYKYHNTPDRNLFIIGTFLGGAYEYICSVFSELVFGKVFWDYSEIPFNLGGRINLLYCFFWGIAAVIWLKILYPVVSKWIEKIPMKFGKIFTWIMVVFVVADIAVSCLALIRSDERSNGIEAQYSWQKVMDEHYDDARLKKIYPNALETD